MVEKGQENNYKIEIFYEQSNNIGYYYDTVDNLVFQKEIILTGIPYANRLKMSLVTSTTIGLFSMIINRWYETVATTVLNIILTIVAISLLIIFSQFVNLEISKQNKPVPDIDFEITPKHNIENVVMKSEKLIRFWVMTASILSATIVIGISIFYYFNQLIGLVMFSMSIEGMFLIFKYVRLSSRMHAVKQLKRNGGSNV
ncbi:TPA: hypothetical protein TXJ06_000549 [Streptococcus suis]|nr:hypothetical protein [Streptococcus suis]